MTESKLLGALLAQSRRQTELLALIALPIAQELAASLLSGEKERAVYQLSDGTRSVRAIETVTGVPKSTVARWWKQWRLLGLVVDEARGSRAVFSADQVAPASASGNGTTTRRKGV